MQTQCNTNTLCPWIPQTFYYHPHSEGDIVFSVSVCVSVCSVNTITPEPLDIIITEFSGHHPTIERADKFKNGYRGARVVV